MKRRGLAFLLLLVATAGRGEHSVGNPGDPVRLIISEARDDARIITIQVKPDLLQPVSDAAKTFWQTNYDQFEPTLKDATFTFIPDDKPYCAEAVRTEMTIYFSYPQCTQTVKSKADAIKLLLHETTHLLGNTDEQLADDVAISVYNTWLGLDANKAPRWDAVNPNGAPPERAAHASASFRDADGHDKLFVWGGCNENNDLALECSNFLGDGAIYDLTTQTWTAVPAPPAGDTRAYATATFTGIAGPAARHVLVFGGCNGADGVCRTAYSSLLSYDLATGAWTAVQATGDVPTARVKHHAFWTGKELFIWGGVADPAGVGLGQSLGDGALFDPATNVWRKIADTGAPTPRRFDSAVLTGTEDDPDHRQLIIYGGCDRQVGRYCPNYFKDGGIYSLATQAWRPLDSGGFGARAWHSAVWTGTQMIVWGGLNRTTLRDGAVFTPGADLAHDNWFQVSGVVDDGRYEHAAAWTGDRMLVFGGETTLGVTASKVIEFYLPDASNPYGRWNTPDAPASPVGRWESSLAWTGEGLLVWGGISEDRAYLNSGGLYVPKMGP